MRRLSQERRRMIRRMDLFTRKRSLWLFLLPGLAGLMFFYVLPFIGGIWYSLTDGSYKNSFVGMRNYLNIWNNTMFRLGLKNTMELSAICAPLIWLLAFLTASLLMRIRPQGVFFRSGILLPYLMPSSAMLLIWLVIFDYGGVINRLVVLLGFEKVKWLEGSALRTPIILLFVWKNLGFATVIFLSALQEVPEPLYEYARLEGAGFLKQTFGITLPLIIPSSFLVMILEWINAFKIFKEVYFIGGAYPDESVYTLQNYMNNMFSKLNYQNVTTAAYSFAVIVFALFGILYFTQRRLLKRLG